MFMSYNAFPLSRSYISRGHSHRVANWDIGVMAMLGVTYSVHKGNATCPPAVQTEYNDNKVESNRIQFTKELLANRIHENSNVVLHLLYAPYI